MATVKFSAIVSDVRGKVGGVVFSRGVNGSYIRKWAKGANRNTASQQIKRNTFSTYVGKWRGLSPIEKQSWKDATALFTQRNRVGDIVQLSGYQLYLRTNLRLETAALDT